MELTNVNLAVPKDMVSFIATSDKTKLMRQNAMILYPYIKDLSISHGRAAEILGIKKLDLIDLYDKMGFPYFDMDISEVRKDIQTFRELKKALA